MENDINNIRTNNINIIREKDEAITSLSSNVEKIQTEVSRNLEEMRILTLERGDLSNYITDFKSYFC